MAENRDLGISSADILARIQVNRGSNGNMYQVLFNESDALKEHVRSYFGPVDIKRLQTVLYNDKGQKMDLHGQDFSYALSIEELYQY
jgi:hypothetical protein